uniref:FGENESH: predicted gene_9.189 protein n=1 Tax=Rhodotorula toruloides TaxID=5286 RepID=A0A0K3CJZ2_RHOTO
MTASERTFVRPRHSKSLAQATIRLKERREEREHDATQVELAAVRKQFEEERARNEDLLRTRGAGGGVAKVLQKEVSELKVQVHELEAALLSANAERDEYADPLESAQANEEEHARRKEAMGYLERETKMAQELAAAVKRDSEQKEVAMHALQREVEEAQRVREEALCQAKRQEERARRLEEAVAEAEKREQQVARETRKREITIAVQATEAGRVRAAKEEEMLRDRARAAEERERKLLKDQRQSADKKELGVKPTWTTTKQKHSAPSTSPPGSPRPTPPSDSETAHEFFEGGKILRSASDGKLSTMQIGQLRSEFVTAKRYLTRFYDLLDTLALTDRDVTNMLLAPETVRNCIKDLPAKSLIDYVHKSVKGHHRPFESYAEEQARKFRRKWKKAERDLDWVKQRRAGLDVVDRVRQRQDNAASQLQIARLQAEVAHKDHTISELTSDYEDRLEQLEAQVDDLEDRLEQADAEFALAEARAGKLHGTVENGSKAACLVSCDFPFASATATLDYVCALLPRLAQVIEGLEEENENLREDAAFLMARQALQA